MERNITHPGPRSCAAGFTLMEVLVTIVILSIGLLGVAGLQMNSLRGNQNALDSTVAVSLVREGADRVRANLPAVREDNGKGALLPNSPYELIDSAGVDPGCISSGSVPCSPSQVAQTDAFEWITSVAENLPGGVGVICRDSTPNDGHGGGKDNPWDPMCDGASEVFAVKVAWDHDKDPETVFTVYRMSFMP